MVEPREGGEFEELSTDCLSLRGYQEYTCNDYHLGMSSFMAELGQCCTFIEYIQAFDSEQRQILMDFKQTKLVYLLKLFPNSIPTCFYMSLQYIFRLFG